VTDRGGQPSVTKYERLSTTSAFSLVRCRLITGRTHQIRVHLSARGWPIVGDAVYGRKRQGGEPTAGEAAAQAFPRQALHAWRLALRHPTTNETLEILAPLPGDMMQLAAALCLPTDALA
jgi:23S rRNA pseudouridine1911/1915/1917 synthase